MKYNKFFKQNWDFCLLILTVLGVISSGWLATAFLGSANRSSDISKPLIYPFGIFIIITLIRNNKIKGKLHKWRLWTSILLILLAVTLFLYSGLGRLYL